MHFVQLPCASSSHMLHLKAPRRRTGHSTAGRLLCSLEHLAHYIILVDRNEIYCSTHPSNGVIGNQHGYLVQYSKPIVMQNISLD